MTPRLARPADLPAIDALLARSFPVLLKADYPPSVVVTALPRLGRAQPRLVASGTYWVTMEGRAAVACGGWTAAAPRGGAAIVADVRHVATDPAHVRRGLGRALMEAAMAQARGAGASAMRCLSTRTAVPFYAALGFEAVRAREIALAPGVAFQVVEMRRAL